MSDICELEEPQPFTASEQDAIDELRNMCSGHSKIHFQTETFFLTKYLRHSDWNVKAAYKAIINNYEMKVKNILRNKILQMCLIQFYNSTNTLYCSIFIQKSMQRKIF